MITDSSAAPFPTPPVPARREGTNPIPWRILLALVAAFVLLFQLGGRGLNEPDEGRFAEAGREMVASGDYLTPHLNGAPHLAKPPLTYWLIAFGLKTCGVNEFGARLPAAVAAMGTLLAVYLLGRRAAGEACGLWAAAVLLSSLLFIGVARLITTDMLLTCWVTWSAWALWHWSESKDRGWRHAVWFYIFMGLGVITKGPVAVLLPLFALAGMRWRSPEFRLRQMGWGRGIVVILAISLPWFLAVAWGRPDVWRYFLGRETVGRVLSDVHGRGEPWWYFLPVLAGGMLPWTPWLALTPLIRRSVTPREARLLRMCLVWASAGLLLFTLSRSKLPTYVLPLTPPLALLTAMTLVRLPQVLATARLRRISRLCGIISAVVLVGIGLAIAVAAPARYQLPLTLAVIPVAVAVLTVVMMLVVLETRGLLHGAGMLVAATLAVIVSVLALVPRVERFLGSKSSAKFMAARIRREDPQQQATVLVYGKLLLGLPFYLERTVQWYRPPASPASAPEPPAFEYNAAAGRAQNVIEQPEQLKAILTGSKRVFCVAVTTEDADELVRNFGLQELERESRRILLVTPAAANVSQPPPAATPVAVPPDQSINESRP